MEIILGIATLLGGIAAAWFFWDKYRRKKVWIEEEKLVNSNWFDSSSLKSRLEENGYTFRWSNPDRIQERITSGYEIIYDEDRNKGIRYKLVNKSGQILIGKVDV